VKRLGVALLAGAALAAHGQQRAIAPESLRSGITFAGPAVQAMQSDDAANPAYLWIERGERLWSNPSGAQAKSCASCHRAAASSMRGVAARYPAVDAASGELLDLPARIGDWHARHQGTPAMAPESEDLLALTAYVALQSRGMPVKVSIDGPARVAFERARAFYYERHGQMNLSCAQCHERNWGRRLYNEVISQGHGTAFPAYRLEWQALGSLDRRLRACLFGIRAEVPPPGSKALIELALFLAWRAEGMKLEAPGVRR
jgi:sulfur-oxidizing protein SoxA